MTAMLEMRGISKSFAGVKALRDVNFTVDTGQIHALVGENGAGKSTLMKVLSGVYATAAMRGRSSSMARSGAFATSMRQKRSGSSSSTRSWR